MAIQANNIIDANTIRERRDQKMASMHSLARLQDPPDLQPLSTALQTTLKLDEMLEIFHHEMSGLLATEGLVYRNAESGQLIRIGVSARHSASYSLSLQDETLGELTLARSQPFAEQDLGVLEHLLCALLYPIRNALRYHNALANAFIDPLTRLNNRAALDQALNREVQLAQRHHQPLHLLMADLDHFKQVNDRFGHLSGDCILRHSAGIIRELLRGSDEVFRYGGEEFVILLPATERAGALQVAERIRQQIAATPCHCEGHSITVTCSIGVAELAAQDSADSLFDRADKALYRAKEEGRNRVVV